MSYAPKNEATASYQAAPQQHYVAAPTMADVYGVPQTEYEQRRMWKRRAFWSVILGALFIFVGSTMIAIRDNGTHGACCLPKDCDVSQLENTDWAEQSHSGKMCSFTAYQIAKMGCAASFEETSKCTLQLGLKDHHFPCDHNASVGNMIGAGVTIIVVGSLSVIVGLAFFAFGFDCYGDLTQPRTCCNWVARVFTAIIWQTAVGGAITGIVFGSLAVHSLFSAPFNTHPTCHHHHKYGGCKPEHGAFWAGESCPVSGQPADVFSWIKPTHNQKAHGLACLVMSVCFVLFTIACFVKLIAHCCRKCNERHHHHQHATAAVAVPAPVQYGGVAQPTVQYDAGAVIPNHQQFQPQYSQFQAQSQPASAVEGQPLKCAA